MEDKIRKYAKFLVEGCLKLKKGDKLFIVGITLIKDFIDIVIEEALKLGIENIETLISNPYKQREMYMNNTLNEIKESPLFDRSKYNEMAKEGYAFLNIYSPMPNFLSEVNADILSEVSRFQMESIKDYRERQNKGLIKWNISSVPNLVWANSLDMDINHLWELILDICLINEENIIGAWTKKLETMAKRASYLNNLDIDKLVYKNSLGTNLEIGLPKGYLFQCADGINIVNMPTEEVFTSPDRLRVNGIVYSSKMLIHNDNVIDDFWLSFKNGEIIDFDAKCGKDILKGIIETDEGSRFLGEVALVDYDSPISKTEVVSKNTLYDENASCHLAIGASFAECIEDGLTKTNEELLKLGLNYSKEHVDFFIGNRDLEIKAVLQNGEEVVIMENGNFVGSENL